MKLRHKFHKIHVATKHVVKTKHKHIFGGLVILAIGLSLILWALQRPSVAHGITSGTSLAQGAPTFLTVSNSTAPLSPAMWGFNATDTPGSEWTTGFGNLVSGLKPEALRYPGGVAQYFNWHDGTFWNLHLTGSTNPYVGVIPLNADTIQSFAAFVKANNITPLIDVNVLTSGPDALTCVTHQQFNSTWQAMIDDQINYLQTLQSLGVPIKYVELGNEVWSSNPDYSCIFPTGADYGLIATYWIADITKAFPGVSVSPNAYSYPSDPDNIRANNWNSSMLTTLKGYTSITFPKYGETNLAPANEQLCPNGQGQHDETTAIKTQTGVDNFLSIPNTLMSEYEPVMGLFASGTKFEISEYNLDNYLNASKGNYGGIYGTWAASLYDDQVFFNFMQDPRINMANLFTLWQSSSYGTIFANTDGFPLQCNKLPTTTPYTYDALGYNYSLIGQAIQGMTSYRTITFSSNPTRTGKYGTFQSLIGYQFLNAARTDAIVVNLSPNVVTASLSGALSGFNTYESINAAPSDLIATQAQVHLTTNTISGDFSIPAYSVTYLTQTGQSNQPPAAGGGSSGKSNGVVPPSSTASSGSAQPNSGSSTSTSTHSNSVVSAPAPMQFIQDVATLVRDGIMVPWVDVTLAFVLLAAGYATVQFVGIRRQGSWNGTAFSSSMPLGEVHVGDGGNVPVSFGILARIAGLLRKRQK